MYRQAPASIRERVGDEDRVVTLGACGQKSDGALNQFLDPAHILDRVGRQVGPASRAFGRLAPARHLFVKRGAAPLLLGRGGQVIQTLPVDLVADADFQRFEPVQHVKLGQRNTRHTRGGTGLPHQGRIEPAAPPLAPRHGAEFAPARAKAMAVLVFKLGGKGSFAHAGRIGLHDPQHIVDRPRPDTHPGGGLPGDHVRRGDKGVGAEINVQKRALRPFEQDTFTAFLPLVQHFPDGRGIGQDLLGDVAQFGNQRVPVDRLDAQPATQRIVMLKRTVHPRLQRGVIRQIGHPHGPAAHLVLIGRADTTARSANLGPLARGFFAGAVQFTVNRQDKRRVLRDHQRLGRDFDTLFADGRDLGHKVPRIKHHAIADDTELAAPHHARRQRVELVNLTVDHKGVARVVTALKARDHIGPLTEPVHDLAFSLVTPLGAHDDDISHYVPFRRLVLTPAPLIGPRQSVEPQNHGSTCAWGLDTGSAIRAACGSRRILGGRQTMTGFLLRWAVAFGLLTLTFNPTAWNYLDWSRRSYGEQTPLIVLLGLLLLMGYVIYLRATFRSIGGFGMIMVIAVVAALFWVLYDYGLLTVRDESEMVWLGLLVLSLVLGIGLSWSHVRRRLSGQSDMDDVSE